MQRALQLPPAGRRGADLADDDARAEIRERGGIGWRQARRDAGPEERDDGVAGARDVENLASLGGQRQRLRVLLKQRHALLAARDQQQVEIELRAQRFALTVELRFVGTAADDGLELAAVRRQRIRAAIA